MRRYIAYIHSRVAALSRASIALAGAAASVTAAAKDAGRHKDGESQHKDRGGTREHVEFAKAVWVDELRIVRLRVLLEI